MPLNFSRFVCKKHHMCKVMSLWLVLPVEYSDWLNSLLQKTFIMRLFYFKGNFKFHLEKACVPFMIAHLFVSALLLFATLLKLTVEMITVINKKKKII